MSSRRYGSLSAGIMMCSLCMPASAQLPVPGAHDNAPGVGVGPVGSELYAGESDDVGPQVALSAKSPGVHVEVSGDMQYYHTSNMFLTEDTPYPNVREQGSDVLLTTVDLAVAPDPAVLGEGDFQPRLGYRQQWYFFSHENGAVLPPGTSRSYDFYAQTLFMEARYRYRKQWLFAGGVDWTQLSMTHGDSNIYSEVVPRWSVQRLFALDDSKVIMAGYQGAYHATIADSQSFGDPSNLSDRIDQGLFVNYTQSITPQLFVQPYYQYKYTRYAHYFANFSEESRHDNLHTLGATVSYYFIPEISLRAFASYEVSDSSVREYPFAAIYDYKKLDSGLGLNLNYRF